VKDLTGRKVRGFVSGIDVHRDIATEIFYLEPVGTPASQGTEERSDELSP
jgi:hypothetical protein